MTVGVMLIATGDLYHSYIDPLLESLYNFFLPEADVRVYLWTDMERAAPVFRQYEHQAEPWPFPTLHRYHTFLSRKDDLLANEHLFYLDVDMLVVGHVGREILGDGLTATLHPLFTKPVQYLPPFEQNPLSTAYLPRYRYYAGGFQGGRTDAFLAMAEHIRTAVDSDRDQGIVATWHDESHFNKYISSCPPAVELTPSYCFPETALPGRSESDRTHLVQHVWEVDYEPKILALQKPKLGRN